MPQIRGAITSASRGSLPARICSKPRYSDPAVVDVQRHLQVTLDAVERADNDASSGVAHRYLVLLTLGAIRA